ncbi:hypothetical protein D9Q98_007161 [Chlorella vulgaris]|uniref:CBM20 domain-containing protein n=1 Tax=Chlorella vulgaris TaxID=3077 RepID=A0A9D4TJM4_CHLVU|nr:hypothetical protein D9Q98_007161 [Chlorella vulgaris]
MHPAAAVEARACIPRRNRSASSSSSSSSGITRCSWTRCAGQPASRATRKWHQHRVECIAVPGPLFMDSGFDRDRLRDSKAQQLLPPGNFLQFPMREDSSDLRKTPPLVRVRLAVEYRVHSRQMLCVGGNQIPFGWSFLSIAKVPASWNPGDIWAVEIELPAGTKVEYKFVILEEQDWTQQVNELSEGKVEYSYRIEPDSSPPDVQKITKQMAIVAWQPGPNRVLQVPTEEELAQLRPGERVERDPPPLPSTASQRSYGQQALGKLLGQQPTTYPISEPPIGTGDSPSSSSSSSGVGSSGSSGPTRKEELCGVWEVLSIDQDGRPFLDRRDVWGREDQPSRSVRRSLFGR